MDIQNIIDLNIDETSEDFTIKRGRLLRKQVPKERICAKDERNASIKKVSQILQKGEKDRTVDELQMLTQCSEAVQEVQSRWKKRDRAKHRAQEFEEPFDQLEKKCQMLAQTIAQSEHLVVYTGAGISTAAQIPDYRGPNGIWTMLQQGKDIGNHDLSQAEPTFTHMALYELYKKNILKYVVSQNCDGLHLRSGLPRESLSELHGNMYIEVCKNCKPPKEYLRYFDVTENTARYSHKTMRKCYTCNNPLIDTIVHFGERGSLVWPLNWNGACKNAKRATTIICLGSSLKVLKKYPWLWQMDKAVKKRAKLFIVNLQWTPKDDCANVKINGKCDVVMKMVMDMLGILVQPYTRDRDPIFSHATDLCAEEAHTTTQPLLQVEDKDQVWKETADNDVEYKNKCPIPLDLSKKTTNYCDNTSNMDTHDCNIFDKLPAKITENNNVPKSNITFSIDNILDNERKPAKMFQNEQIDYLKVPQNYHPPGNIFVNPNFTLLTYYQLSNILWQNQLMNYQDPLYYPFQTSLLYSGLHSIINPSPYYVDLTYDRLNRETPVKLPTCEFCNKNYNSTTCLFYVKSDPIFVKQEIHVSKKDNSKKLACCVCCDYSTDEEDVDDSESEKIPDKVQKCNNDQEINTALTERKIQAGWFGKGYKKYRKFKKR